MLKTLFLPGLVMLLASAGGPAKELSAKDVDAVLGRYRTAEAFKAAVKKTVVNDVIGTEATGDGRFYFSKGKLRLEMGEPENTTLIYDGKVVWMETRLDENTVSVIRVKSKDLKKNDSLLAGLFDRKDILNSFNMTKAREDQGKKIYSFVPKKQAKTEVRFLEIALEGKELERITYKDDRENSISFQFQEIHRQPISATKFKYQPPKDASVVDI